MSKFIQSIAIAFWIMAIALFPANPTLANTVQSQTQDTARQAAEAVVQDTGVKEQFGKSKNGERLLDGAQKEANKNLKKIADKVDSQEELSNSEQLFLDNLSDR